MSRSPDAATMDDRERRMVYWLRRVFETDVTAAQHEDPMTDEDWLTLARKALEVADDPGF